MRKVLTTLALVFAVAGIGQPTPPQATAPPKRGSKVLEGIIGKWKGTCKTWFEPDKLADESEVKGEFTKVMGGRFVRHNYVGSMQKKPRTGEELIAFNKIDKVYEVSWIDDFHMNYAILFSTGPEIEKGFAVTGHYDVGPKEPKWGWRTEYRLMDANHMTITAYNIFPSGQEAKATELEYVRVK